LVCGRFQQLGLAGALNAGWVFIRCPECQRGIPFDIVAGHLIKSTREEFIEGFCPDHWFKESGICSYCRMRRIAAGNDPESMLSAGQQQQYNGNGDYYSGASQEQQTWR
jgi:hypothetical protein